MAKWTCCDVVELLLLSIFFFDARCRAFISIKTFASASSWHASSNHNHNRHTVTTGWFDIASRTVTARRM
jgi:hypothetical protein